MTFAVSPVLGTSQVPLLVIIDLYCHGEIPSTAVPSIMTLLVSLVSNEEYLPTLKELLARVSTEIKGYAKCNPDDLDIVERLILSKLKELDSLDCFYDYLTNMTHLLIDPPIDLIGGNSIPNRGVKQIQSSSFLGKFLTKIVISVKVMTFDEMIIIWKAFCQYRKPILGETEIPFWSQLLSHAGSTSNENLIDKVISQEDLMSLFVFQIDQIQSNSNPIPENITKILKELTHSQRHGVNRSYYIEYLQYWRSGDYENSLNALHRYFDYMMSSKQKYYYHYALLALATLHSSFGCEMEAIRAINEAIMVAREARDTNCLNYLLAWLFDFLNERPHLENEGDMNRDQILEFLELKSKQRHNSTLHCISYMNKAQMGLLKGQPMAEVHKNLISASHLALHSSISAPQMNNLIHVCRLIAQMWLLIGGFDSLFDIYIEIALEFSDRFNDWNEKVEINLLKARRIYESGDYLKAINILNADDEKVKNNKNLYKKWKVKYHLIELDHIMKTNGNRHEAEILLTDIISIGEELNHIDIINEIDYMRAKYQIWMGDTITGCQILMDCLSEMRNGEKSNSYWYLKYQLLFGEIMDNRGASVILNVIELSKKCGFGRITKEAEDIIKSRQAN